MKPKPTKKWTGREVRGLRLKLGVTQQDFWCGIYITQAGGSRYESTGRRIPPNLQSCLTIRYGSDDEAFEELKNLRQGRVYER